MSWPLINWSWTTRVEPSKPLGVNDAVYNNSLSNHRSSTCVADASVGLKPHGATFVQNPEELNNYLIMINSPSRDNPLFGPSWSTRGASNRHLTMSTRHFECITVGLQRRLTWYIAHVSDISVWSTWCKFALHYLTIIRDRSIVTLPRHSWSLNRKGPIKYQFVRTYAG